MNENRETRKSFDNGPPVGAPPFLPPLLARLLRERLVYAHLTGADLREMSKFGEIPNIEGLAAHPIRRPSPARLNPADPAASGEGPQAISPEPVLPGGVEKALRSELVSEPCVLVRGTLAGNSAAPAAVQVIVPQYAAHLAAALKQMLWPLTESAGPAERTARIDYTLFIWPDRLQKPNGQTIVDQLIGHWPEEGTGIVIGFDDPRLAAGMLVDAARRRWRESEEPRSLRIIPADAILPGWPSNAPPRTGQIRIAQELFLVEGERRDPIWRNPLLPAGPLARDETWRAAVMAPGALPFGVRVDDEGRFPLFHDPVLEVCADEDPGCIVVRGVGSEGLRLVDEEDEENGADGGCLHPRLFFAKQNQVVEMARGRRL